MARARKASAGQRTGSIRPGDPYRLGASWDGAGTNFAVFSSAAAYGGSVQLCLLDASGAEEVVPLWTDCDIWHAYVSDVGPGQGYGYRVDGPTDPARGLFFDRAVLLLDPYARLMGEPDPANPRLLRSEVADEAFDWGDDRPPRRPWADTVLYETHVKGLTATHPGVPVEQRGTYAGLASPPVLKHLVDLGVTAAEIMPVQQFLTEPFLVERGLSNYWGYSTIGFFAPHAAYASSPGRQIVEFKEMVRALHRAGIEVILDVVYNHTAEGGPGGPALCFRGLANDIYYRLDPADLSRYVDTTGTGNSLNPGRPEVLRLILDSLRYWVTQMRVDGFRFDLAAALARDYGYVDRLAAFFDLVYQDPVINRVKLIAEPWDLGASDGYQVGRFPTAWAEWNDRYRNGVRDFWRGAGGVGDFASRLSGSSDLYGASRRGPDASVNFVTAHDGMTLTDLVTYRGKHNEANLEDNRDGTDDNRSDNYGVEGPSDDPGITAIRERQRRNFLATLLLSQGVPMICGGDEIGRTQRGNNNAYCQDNEISWYDWNMKDDATQLVSFVQRLTSQLRAHPVLRRRGFLDGQTHGGELPDITWYAADGQPMNDDRWRDPAVRFLACLLAGDRVDAQDPAGMVVVDDDVIIVCNAGTQPVSFPLPGRPGAKFTVVLDTSQSDGSPTASGPMDVGATMSVPERAVVVATAPLQE